MWLQIIISAPGEEGLTEARRGGNESGQSEDEVKAGGKQATRGEQIQAQNELVELPATRLKWEWSNAWTVDSEQAQN